MLENFKKSKFNESLHRRIEIKDGKPKLGEIPDKPLFGKNTPINPKYEMADTPQVMGAEGLGFGNELLKNNKERFLKQIEKLAKEKGTWTPENLRNKEDYKKAIYNLPLIHVTLCNNFGNKADFKNVITSLETYGLQSHDNLLKIRGDTISQDDDKPTTNWSKTYTDDLEIGRDKYVYFSLGNTYMTLIGNKEDFCAVILGGNKLQKLNCLVQTELFKDKLGIPQVSISHNKYQNINESSLLGQDFVELMSLAIATEVISYSDMGLSEVMFKGFISEKDIDFVLFSGCDYETNELYESAISVINKFEKDKYQNKKRPIAYTFVPDGFFYRMQISKASKFLKPDFTKPNTPWYQKVYENFLEESKSK